MKNSTIKKSFTAKLKKSPVQFRRLTGITPEKFDEVLKKLTPLYRAWKINHSKAKKRCYGGGNVYTLPLEDRLLLCLLYYRTYTTQMFLSFLFCIDETTVSRNIRPIEQCLARVFRIPERKIQLTNEEITEAFFDGTE